ncbi:MAG: sugar nucleotide-binding protein [Candidatus Kapabacteria bacterium]|nr:sugar nucleotide-binding protein [Ignavibacteriota bacterium]MCW5883857.1 sugar nucleotide-binding protein [Candidatus Kapabacteria bacterium]
MKRILILGKQSRLAVAIYVMLTRETDWKVYFDLDSLDSEKVTDTGQYYPIVYEKKDLRKVVMEYDPDYIVNCLSFDVPEIAEVDKKFAWDYNVGNIEAISKAAMMTDSKLLMFSTDNIYSGINGPYGEDHLPEPVNYYGKTKLGSENHCISNNVPFISVRLPEYYGGTGSNAFNIYYKLINNIEQNLAVNCFTTPVYIDDAALAVLKIILKDKFGFYNLGGPDYVSEYEYGVKLADVLGFEKESIKPYTYSNSKNECRKLIRGGLINIKSETDLNMKFVNLHSGLSSVKFLENLKF